MLTDTSVVCPVLIGREAPLTTAFHTLERARASHGGTLLVSGEAGIGKSRLTRATVERARSLGFVTLQGACFEADRAQPYAPLLDLVRALSTTASPALAAHYFAPAADALVTLFPELRSVFPDAVVRASSDPEEERRRLFHEVSEALYALARVQPLLVVIEDVHWSDDATLDLLLHLSRRLLPASMALVLTFRNDEVGPRLARMLADLDRARCAAEVALRPLDADDVARMLHAIFGSAATLGPGFVDALHGLTEGNPFFVEEMLRALLDAGDLERSDGGWRARSLDHVVVPRTATEAVARRLAGLSDAARDVASVAAVAGRRFDFAMMQALTRHDEDALLALMKELVAAQLVVEESADQFAFRHALTREAMRARLLARERAALHRAIAARLEERFDPEAHDVSDALAYHAFEGGMWEAARRYALRAAEHALTLCAPREALQQFDRAVTATMESGGRPDAALLVARGRAHETLGDFPRALADFSAALSGAREEGDARGEWRALYALGMLWAARDYEQAGRHRRDALAVARGIGDQVLIAHSLNRVGNWYVNREDPDAGIPSHDEALAIFEATGDRRGVAETTDLLAMAHHIAGRQSEAARHYEASVTRFTALEDRRGLSNALAVLSVCGPSVHASAGPVDISPLLADALEHETAVRHAVDIGWRAGEAFSRYLLGDCHGWRGDYARALRLTRESLAIAEELEHLEWQCGARRVLGAIALDLFAGTEALRQLEQAHDVARRLGSATWIRWTGAPLAIALARLGNPARASAVLAEIAVLVPARASGATGATPAPATLGERYLAMAAGHAALAAGDYEGALGAIAFSDPRPHGSPCIALLRGEALAGLRRWDEALASLGLAQAEAERQGARPLAWQVEAARGRVFLGQRRRRDARGAFDTARTVAARLVEGLEEPELLAGYTAGVDRLVPPPPRRSRAQAVKEEFGGLTRRERDTAALIAQGKSNRAIARHLGIGERTVEGYVAAALAKLGFSSRAQVAVWAADRGLAPPAESTGRRRR